MQPLIISACLLGVNCKYNASNNKLDDITIQKLQQKYNLIPICPEIMGGMPTPRNPVEIKNGKIIDQKNNDYTQNFQKGAQESLKIAQLFHAQKALLKESSPSCGSHTIYDGSFTHKKIPGMGITAEKLSHNKIQTYSEENVKILL